MSADLVVTETEGELVFPPALKYTYMAGQDASLIGQFAGDPARIEYERGTYDSIDEVEAMCRKMYPKLPELLYRPLARLTVGDPMTPDELEAEIEAGMQSLAIAEENVE